MTGERTMTRSMPLAASLVAACSLSWSITVPSAAAMAAAVAPSASPTPFAPAIRHIVIIVQENRTIDGLFNGFPGADTVRSGVESDGTTVPLVPRGFEAPGDIAHSHENFETEYAGGKMYFDRGAPRNPSLAYSYVPRSETTPLWSLAEQYVLGDRTFQSNNGPSFEAHQYLIAGTSQVGPGQFAVDNPYYKNFTPVPLGEAWGCDDPAGTFLPLLDPAGGATLVGPFPCFDNTTLADELTAKGLTWRQYAPAVGKNGAGKEGVAWSAFDAIKHIRYGDGWNNVVSPETNVLDDAPAGNVASVTWVIPTLRNSDHAGSNSALGPQWVASVVNAVGRSPAWNSTAIFIVWDDWGGWYDHVVPPQLDNMGLGFRVPLIVVSPYAKHGYVSHVQHESASILRFAERVFGLAPLAQSDARADDLGDCFDFTQAPRSFVPILTSQPPAAFFHGPESEPPDND
jgi:phospholipase C